MTIFGRFRDICHPKHSMKKFRRAICHNCNSNCTPSTLTGVILLIIIYVNNKDVNCESSWRLCFCAPSMGAHTIGYGLVGKGQESQIDFWTQAIQNFK